MPKKEAPIAIYSRKSRFTGKGESVENQIGLCREYILRQFGETALSETLVFEDEGFSGGNLQRPALQEMLRYARETPFRAIVVYRLDRISRNIGDFSCLIEELNRMETAFISIREQFDTGNPMGRAMMYMASVFSQLERETIAERIRDNLRELAKTGRWLGGVTPTGFSSECVESLTSDGKIKKVCRLRLIPEEGETIRLIYRLFLQKGSLTGIETALTQAGILSKNHRPYTRFSLKGILQNPVYLTAEKAAYLYFSEKGAELFSTEAAFDGSHGILAYHRTEQKKGKPTVFLPISQWIVSVGDHEGLIRAEEWIEVQRLLLRNQKKSYRRPRQNQALLTGLLRCSCGGILYPKLARGNTEDGRRRFSYLCKEKERSKGALCQQPNLNGPLAEAAVEKELPSLPEDKDAFLRYLSENAAFCCIEKQEGEMQKKAKPPLYKNEDCFPNIEEEEKNFPLSAEELQQAEDTLASFPLLFSVASWEEKQALLRTLLDEVLWDGKTVHIYWRGARKGQEPKP